MVINERSLSHLITGRKEKCCWNFRNIDLKLGIELTREKQRFPVMFIWVMQYWGKENQTGEKNRNKDQL